MAKTRKKKIQAAPLTELADLVEATAAYVRTTWKTYHYERVEYHYLSEALHHLEEAQCEIRKAIKDGNGKASGTSPRARKRR